MTSRRQYLRALPFAATAVAAAQTGAGAAAGSRTYNIRDYGAKGDGSTLDTAAVQAAIDACTKDQGGAVLVPAGDFLVGTLELKSNVTLHLSAGGRLLGSGKPAALQRREGRSSGQRQRGAALRGRRRKRHHRGSRDHRRPGPHSTPATATTPGPAAIALPDTSSARTWRSFTAAATCACSDVFLTAQRLPLHARAGMPLRASERRAHPQPRQPEQRRLPPQQLAVRNIANCNVTCQDDACALFGSNRFVTVTNCTFSTRWSIFRFGGGEAENIAVSNCVIYDTYGCVDQDAFGAGARIENVSFSNLMMRNVTGPISMGLDSAISAAGAATECRAAKRNRAEPALQRHPGDGGVEGRQYRRHALPARTSGPARRGPASR